jgi:hypothetical protein
VIAYRARLDVPRALAQYVGRLLHAERRHPPRHEGADLLPPGGVRQDRLSGFLLSCEPLDAALMGGIVAVRVR